MSIQQIVRQMPASAGREAVGQGEAVAVTSSDEICGPRHVPGDAGSVLLQAALRRENILQAFKRVRPTRALPGSMVGTSTKPRAIWPLLGREYANNCWQGRTGPVRCVG